MTKSLVLLPRSSLPKAILYLVYTPSHSTERVVIRKFDQKVCKA